VGNNIHQILDVSPDLEIETAVLIDTGLPEVLRFVILLGAQGGVVKV
jgi:hypothetical protein